jgi:hypothetical protein
VWFQKKRKAVAALVRAELGESEIVAIDESANCFGLDSKGVTQIRGNGCLAVTKDELLFVMWIPRREIRIPRAWITSVETTKWHLGKTMGKPLLLVRFTDDQARADSVAWYVKDLPAWEAALAA